MSSAGSIGFAMCIDPSVLGLSLVVLPVEFFQDNPHSLFFSQQPASSSSGKFGSFRKSCMNSSPFVVGIAQQIRFVEDHPVTCPHFMHQPL